MRKFYSSPMLIDIDITKRCNLKCDYCSASASPNYDKNEEMTVSEYKRLFKSIDDMFVHRISLGGGEPLIRSDFFEILEAAAKHKFTIVLNSNGTLITEDIAMKLCNYRFDRICITLDGSTKDIHEKHRGRGTFNKVINGIKNSKKYGLPVSTLFTLNKDNADDLVNTIKLNEKLGIEYMSVMMLCPTGRAADGKLLVDKMQWYKLFMQLTEMKLHNLINLNFKIVPPNEGEVFWQYYLPLEHYNKLELLKVWEQDATDSQQPQEISCHAGITSMSIDQNGDVCVVAI